MTSLDAYCFLLRDPQGRVTRKSVGKEELGEIGCGEPIIRIYGIKYKSIQRNTSGKIKEMIPKDILLYS